MIKFTDFSKSYDSQSKNAVENFSLLCEENTCTGLLGLNGAGKTTIMKALCGIHFGKGKIEVCGIDVEKNPQEIKKIAGFVEENAAVSSDYTVSQWLHFRGCLLGLGGKNLEDAYEKAVKECGLEDVQEKKLASLSKGYRQRLAFAKALIGNPKVLVLDESMNGLDPSQIVQMRNLIKNLSKKMTVLLSTHLISEAEALCDKICIISSGKNAAFGTKEEIVRETESKNLEEAFLKLSGCA